MINHGTLRKVDSSEWGTQNSIGKNNSKFRICGDRKVAVYPWLIVEIFTNIADDRKFSNWIQND